MRGSPGGVGPGHGLSRVPNCPVLTGQCVWCSTELLKWELDTLSVECPYRNYMAWCRREQSGCTVLAEIQIPSRRSAVKPLQDRASITYKSAGSLTVTMEKLQISDSGVYWCAVDPKHTRLREVVLSVFKSEYLPRSQGLGVVFTALSL